VFCFVEWRKKGIPFIASSASEVQFFSILKETLFGVHLRCVQEEFDFGGEIGKENGLTGMCSFCLFVCNLEFLVVSGIMELLRQ
jgi:hypothetical protein